MKSMLLLLLSVLTISGYQLTTLGPRGETPVSTRFITLRMEELSKAQEENYTLAIALHDTSSDFSRDVLYSITEQCIALNINIVFLESANFSVSTQKQHYQRLKELKPDLLITLALSPTETTKELIELAEIGTSISFLSNLPETLIHRKHFASVVTDDLFEMGRVMANQIARYSGTDARILYIYHAAEYYVTNQRDRSFRNVIQLAYPEMTIVDSIPLHSPDSIKNEVAHYLETKGRHIDAVYTPWATIAEEILPLISTDNNLIDLYTIDKGKELCYDLLFKHSVKGIVVDDPHELGRALLTSTILHKQSKLTPSFASVTVSAINSDTTSACRSYFREE